MVQGKRRGEQRGVKKRGNRGEREPQIDCVSTNPAGREKRMPPNGPLKVRKKGRGGLEINDIEARFNKGGTEE